MWKLRKIIGSKSQKGFFTNLDNVVDIKRDWENISENINISAKECLVKAT
jgi:hypothetical protein